jgi:hypothetical protein
MNRNDGESDDVTHFRQEHSLKLYMDVFNFVTMAPLLLCLILFVYTLRSKWDTSAKDRSDAVKMSTEDKLKLMKQFLIATYGVVLFLDFSILGHQYHHDCRDAPQVEWDCFFETTSANSEGSAYSQPFMSMCGGNSTHGGHLTPANERYDYLSCYQLREQSLSGYLEGLGIVFGAVGLVWELLLLYRTYSAVNTPVRIAGRLVALFMQLVVLDHMYVHVLGWTTSAGDLMLWLIGGIIIFAMGSNKLRPASHDDGSPASHDDGSDEHEDTTQALSAI